MLDPSKKASSAVPKLVPTGGVGVSHPQAQFLSAQGQIWHFCRQISKLVIYVGKMQKFLYLSAKSYAPV